MRVDAKICGITTPNILAACRREGVSHVGLNFVETSPRYLDPSAAAELAKQAAGMMKVGLFVRPTDADIDAARPALDAIQLHGDEPPERLAELGARTGLPVWKALGIASLADLADSRRYHEVADLILYDAKPPSAATRAGGHGVRFDWDMLTGHDKPRRWGLAGGLTPENVARAIAATGAPLVDTASGVEEAVGQKSAAKIADFMEAVRTS
ncbi:MAG: phosphoribosylanthranilate isomerase [Pacificimonas sp.]